MFLFAIHKDNEKKKQKSIDKIPKMPNTIEIHKVESICLFE